MVYVSYVVSFISTVLGLCEPFGKSMRVVLALNFLGNLLVGTSYILVGSYSGAAICYTACLQVFINYYFDARGKKIPTWLICTHAVAFIAVNLTVFASWRDLISLAATMAYVLGMAQSNVSYYRLFYAANSFLWIFYDAITKSYGNLFTHIVLFVFTSIAIMVNKQKKS